MRAWRAGAPALNVTICRCGIRKKNTHLNSDSISRLYRHRTAILVVVIIALADFNLRKISHFDAARRHLAYILSIDTGVKMYVLLFHGHLQARAEQSTQCDVMTCRHKWQRQVQWSVGVEGLNTTPLASARGTGEEAAREAEDAPVN